MRRERKDRVELLNNSSIYTTGLSSLCNAVCNIASYIPASSGERDIYTLVYIILSTICL